jgi:hypothetical protein
VDPDGRGNTPTHGSGVRKVAVHGVSKSRLGTSATVALGVEWRGECEAEHGCGVLNDGGAGPSPCRVCLLRGV